MNKGPSSLCSDRIACEEGVSLSSGGIDSGSLLLVGLCTMVAIPVGTVALVDAHVLPPETEDLLPFILLPIIPP